jgi:DNA-binding beta-propeller fold protein YncE
VWVISFNAGSVFGIDARTSKRTAVVQLPDPRGTAAITAGFGSLWIANAISQTVTRISLATRRAGTAISLPEGKVVSLAAGSGAVWAGSRTGHRNPFLVQNVARVDPFERTVNQSVNVPNGVQDLAVGGGFLWVLNRTKRVVTRIDPGAPDDRRNVPVGHDPQRIAYGGGYVWVTNAADGTVTRIRPRSLDWATIRVGNGPAGVAVGNGVVWVANRLDSTLTRIDPRLARTVGKPVQVGLNPLAVVVHGHSVWVTSVGDNRLTRVDFR